MCESEGLWQWCVVCRGAAVVLAAECLLLHTSFIASNIDLSAGLALSSD